VREAPKRPSYLVSETRVTKHNPSLPIEGSPKERIVVNGSELGLYALTLIRFMLQASMGYDNNPSGKVSTIQLLANSGIVSRSRTLSRTEIPADAWHYSGKFS
jgi:hypothetical protein